MKTEKEIRQKIKALELLSLEIAPKLVRIPEGKYHNELVEENKQHIAQIQALIWVLQ